MPRFVDVDRGYINLDFVQRITERSNGRNGLRCYSFWDKDGQRIGEIEFTSEFDPEDMTDTVVPAAPGATATLLTVFDDAGRPTEADVFTERVPIIAWRIGRYGSRPVLIEPPASNEHVLIEMPDGRLMAPDYAPFSTVDAAKQHFLTAAQDWWDRRHAKSEGTPA